MAKSQKNNPESFRNKRDFERFARRKGATIVEGTSHTKIKTKKGTMVMSRGSRKGTKPNPGLLMRYVKDLKRLGLFLLFCYFVYFALTNLPV